MEIEYKISVNEKLSNNSKRELFGIFLKSDENVLLNFGHSRAQVIFTDKKIITIVAQGITGKKKEYRFIPYSKVTSFSLETTGMIDVLNDFTLWVSGVGKFSMNFGKKINIQEIGVLLNNKIC